MCIRDRIKTDPPDKQVQTHKSVKCSLKTILNHYETFQPYVEDLVLKMNELITLGYQSLKAYIIQDYSRGITITGGLIQHLLRSICEKDEKYTNETYPHIYTFQNKYFKPNLDIDINGENIAQSITYATTEIITCLENNIKNHFKDHLNRLIN